MTMFVLAECFIYWGMSWYNTRCPKGLHYGDKDNSRADHNGALWFFLLDKQNNLSALLLLYSNPISFHTTTNVLLEILSPAL